MLNRLRYRLIRPRPDRSAVGPGIAGIPVGLIAGLLTFATLAVAQNTFMKADRNVGITVSDNDAHLATVKWAKPTGTGPQATCNSVTYGTTDLTYTEGTDTDVFVCVQLASAVELRSSAATITWSVSGNDDRIAPSTGNAMKQTPKVVAGNDVASTWASTAADWVGVIHLTLKDDSTRTDNADIDITVDITGGG